MTSIKGRAAAPRAPLTLALVAGGAMLVAVIAAGGMNGLVLLCVLAMLPLSLLWLRPATAPTPGLYGLDGPIARWALVLAMPALAGLLMASRVQGLGLEPVWAAVAAGMVLCGAVLGFARANPLAQALGAVFALAVSLAFAAAALIGLDVTLDHGAPRIETARVIEMRNSAGRYGAGVQATLASSSGQRSYVLTPARYGRLHEDGPACILHHLGALGFAWSEVSDCGAG